jgi:GT2 family glycosyltransferase
VGCSFWNKEPFILKHVYGLREALSEEDEVIFLFDNCTDESLKTFNGLKHLLPNPRILITNNDLYEVKANNYLLKAASRDTIILFQDDILNHDKDLKKKIFQVVNKYGNKLGLMGGRSGYELTGDPTFPEHSYFRTSNWEHLPKQYDKRLKEGEFVEKTILNRGPLVFTRNLLEEVGYLDEKFAPCWGDDMDYCCRAKFNHERKNVVFQCDVESQLKWGALHSGESKLKMRKVMRKNWNLFISKWGETLKKNYENPTVE